MRSTMACTVAVNFDLAAELKWLTASMPPPSVSLRARSLLPACLCVTPAEAIQSQSRVANHDRSRRGKHKAAKPGFQFPEDSRRMQKASEQQQQQQIYKVV